MSEKSIRILPLPKVTGRWEHEFSDYTDLIQVPMSDGRVINYRRETEQPHPQVMKTLELIRVMNGYTYGGTKK